MDRAVYNLDDVACDDVTVLHKQLIGERDTRQKGKSNHKQGQPVSQVMGMHIFSPGESDLFGQDWHPFQATKQAIM
jgi:hypothetical protein